MAQHVRLEPWAWRLVHAAALAVPVVLALSAARGYYWTALRLGESYHLTLVFAFLLLVALHLALRWTLLARRRLAFEQWRAAARSGARSSATSAEETGERHVLPEPELDLGAVDAQTQPPALHLGRRRAADRALGALGGSRARARRARTT